MRRMARRSPAPRARLEAGGCGPRTPAANSLSTSGRTPAAGLPLLTGSMAPSYHTLEARLSKANVGAWRDAGLAGHGLGVRTVHPKARIPDLLSLRLTLK